MSTREKILSADDCPLVKVRIPEWKCDVWIKSMTVAQREKFEKRHVVDRLGQIRERLIVACVCEEDGSLMFTDLDIPALSEKSCRAADRIFELALTVNGMRSDDIESLKKNSETTPPDASLSS